MGIMNPCGNHMEIMWTMRDHKGYEIMWRSYGTWERSNEGSLSTSYWDYEDYKGIVRITRGY
jgi:hypothetical protein